MEKETSIALLVDICVDLKNDTPGIEIYDRHPYIPYIPDQWNGILVLAEAQQLRSNNTGNAVYVRKLVDLDSAGLKQIKRLGLPELHSHNEIGVTPWDEGYLPLAMMACYGGREMVNEFAVSNAIPWHLIKESKKQEKHFLEQAKIYWEKILPVLKTMGLHTVIRSGTYARDILNKKYLIECIGVSKVFYLRSASQLGRVTYLFSENDLRKRYPEVDKAILDSVNDWNSPGHIFYAAHAVSRIKNYL